MNGDALTTKARIKERLSITTAGFDNFIDNLILGVTARIQQTTGRRFIQGTYTHELHDGSDISGSRRQYLILKNAPVQTVTSVEYNTGTNKNPIWTEIDLDYYDVDLSVGALVFRGFMPAGFRNIRVTYVGGYSGFTLGINNIWVFNTDPASGAVNGVNTTFTLPEAADQVIVYADGTRLASANVSFTAGGTSFSILNNLQPFSSIAVDYLKSAPAEESDYNLPADLVDVCERAVVYLFKSRDNEGKTSESFQESSITWRDSIFNAEMRATIKNYRRGYSL